MDWHTIFVEYLNLISMRMVCFQFFMQITKHERRDHSSYIKLK